jgi:hypothetical protein
VLVIDHGKEREIGFESGQGGFEGLAGRPDWQGLEDGSWIRPFAAFVAEERCQFGLIPAAGN